MLFIGISSTNVFLGFLKPPLTLMQSVSKAKGRLSRARDDLEALSHPNESSIVPWF